MKTFYLQPVNQIILMTTWNLIGLPILLNTLQIKNVGHGIINGIGLHMTILFFELATANKVALF